MARGRKTGRPGGRHLVRASAEYMGAEYRGGSHVKYTWPCGHWRILELRGGPRGHVKPVVPEMVKKLAHYWGPLPAGGVSSPPCATCDQKKRKEAGRTARELAGSVRALRPSQAKAIRDVREKIARLEQRRPVSPRLPEWRAVLAELQKAEYR